MSSTPRLERDYAEKRGRVLASRSNLVEIDLLRGGPRLSALGAPEGFDYGILVARAETRPSAQLIPFGVRDPIPEFRLPLGPGDPEITVSLASVFNSVYEIGRYTMRIDYADAPEPPLRPEDEEWSDRLLRQSELR